MFRTTGLEIDSLNKDIILTELSTRQAMELGLLSKAIPVFQFIYNVMIKITNLEQKDLEKITVQDAVSLMIYYKATFENNIAIGEIEDGDLLATDFIIERKNK